MYTPLKAFIEEHQTITIFSHVYPDGDAIGSMVGIREIIKANYPYKDVFIVGANTAPFSAILGDFPPVTDENIAKSGSIIIDVGNSSRVFDQRFKQAKARIKVDHHIFTEKFCEVEIINNARIAASEMLGEFILAFNLEITPLGATALALGIITDSGRFMYDLTSSLTFEIMGVLLSKGADLALINNKLSERKLDGLKERGYFLSNYQLYKNLIYISVTKEERLQLNLKANEGSKFVNMYAGIEGYPSWATFFEDDDGSIFVEFRSKSRNVQKVALLFGGGGHLKASGCKIKNASVVEEVLNALDDAEVL